MPPHLRTCLLYLCAFPEDFIIDQDDLIWRWRAEGFVNEDEGSRSPFEVGEGYFNDLINRSLIQVPSEWSECRVHDMVLDLLRSIAREENTISRNNVRRLAHQNITVSQTKHMDMPQLNRVVCATKKKC
jgi:hypothetical protein